MNLKDSLQKYKPPPTFAEGQSDKTWALNLNTYLRVIDNRLTYLEKAIVEIEKKVSQHNGVINGSR